MSEFSMRAPATYEVGDRVTHAMLGNGTVISVDATRMSVDFDKRGIRTIILKMAVLSLTRALPSDRG